MISLDRVDDPDRQVDMLAEEGLVQEAVVGHPLEEVDQRVPEAADIDDQHRLGVLVELGPGHHLDDLLERADAAGQRHEGVGALEHDSLPLVHVGG